MIKILESLEPRFYELKELIFKEGEEVNEQIYVTKGNYAVGLSCNNQNYYHIKLTNKTIIGGYENLFGHPSQYLFKALNMIEGYGLRKQKLLPIM